MSPCSLESPKFKPLKAVPQLPLNTGSAQSSQVSLRAPKILESSWLLTHPKFFLGLRGSPYRFSMGLIGVSGNGEHKVMVPAWAEFTLCATARV